MKTDSTKTGALVALALAMTLVLPHAAFAASPAVSKYDVRIVTSSDGATRELLAAVELAPGTQLPAQVTMPIPKGAKVDWVGEILGGDPSQDPKVQYGTDEQADADNLVFTLTKSLRGQVEARMPGVPEKGRVGLSWKVPTAAASAAVAVQIPLGGKVTKATLGSTTFSGQDGSTFYARQYTNVKAGQRLEVKAEYTPGTAAAAPPSQGAPQGQTGQLPVQPQAGAQSLPQAGNRPSPLVAVLALGIILAGTFWALDKVGGRRPAEPEPRRHGR